MSFLIDKQTFTDLEIFEIQGVKNSIFHIFDKAISHGGREALLDMFYNPLSDIKKIHCRKHSKHRTPTYYRVQYKEKNQCNEQGTIRSYFSLSGV